MVRLKDMRLLSYTGDGGNKHGACVVKGLWLRASEFSKIDISPKHQSTQMSWGAKNGLSPNQQTKRHHQRCAHSGRGGWRGGALCRSTAYRYTSQKTIYFTAGERRPQLEPSETRCLFLPPVYGSCGMSLKRP